MKFIERSAVIKIVLDKAKRTNDWLTGGNLYEYFVEDMSFKAFEKYLDDISIAGLLERDFRLIEGGPIAYYKYKLK